MWGGDDFVLLTSLLVHCFNVSIGRVRSTLLLQPGVGRRGFALPLGTAVLVFWLWIQYSERFKDQLSALAQSYMCQGRHVFMFGVCFRDVNLSSYLTWLARPHSSLVAGCSAGRYVRELQAILAFSVVPIGALEDSMQFPRI